MTGIPCEYISWHRFYALCERLHRQIEAAGFQPELIVAIARGGYMPGRVLADFFGLLNLAAVKIEHYHHLHKEAIAVVRHPLSADIDGQRVLLVDDVSDSGDTFSVALQHLATRGKPAALRTAVLHHKLSSSYAPDFYSQRVVKWRWIIYPWAVVEDLSSLLAKADQWPMTAQQASSYLAETHGLRLPLRIMHQVWDKLAPPAQESPSRHKH